MSNKHEEDCDCEHHHHDDKSDSQKHACPSSQFVENLLKELEKDKDLNK